MRYNAADQARVLLDWYDVHARDMPWRVPPKDRKAGVTPDPYHIWMSEVMLQQTTVAAVKDYFRKFIRRWPTVSDLAGAEDADVMAAWAGLGYYARARNLLKCARVVADDLNGVFPDTYDALLKLPGIGPYTAAAVASIAFDRRAVVLDGNVERVMARLHRVEEPLPASKETLRGLADGLTPDDRCGDYAQAVMDLGATICTPRSPACGICPWMEGCAGRQAGDAADFPRKTPKKPKPVRQGVAFVAIRADGAVLMERRPDKGLLGGMLGWPGSEWREEVLQGTPPMTGDWVEQGDVRHTFTHFYLELAVFVARDVSGKPTVGEFLPKEQFSPSDLPTVMRKVWDVAAKG
ncbi:A/G-specific adenine glycosylase [Amylibacter sp. IMCC11727]|uniref:A/G-specific adenine glycosylase n=1 Tax=Amylibacter sp. IMCC11727 TaxID=3039851 RepID=UPI00244D9EC0|nr:A/G-specific adenine glycosylase [Amylibacter sp. IMCC11727]WGI22280.1 A/G-specific adenine glycosylase [Amylibacter sp. IMCC11727]